MLHGKILYVDTVDVKPVGIFLIMALIRLLSGNSVFMVRLFTSLVVAFTSYLIFRIKLNSGFSRKVAVTAGVFYIFMLSVFTFYGISVNTETYFNLFTAGGLFLILKKNNVSNFIIAGILLGCGFIIKYVVLFDLLAFMLFITIVNFRKGKFLNFKSILNTGVLAVSFIIPFGIVNLYYYLIGHYDDFFFHAFKVTGNYPVQRDLMGTIIYILDFHLRFLPVIFFFYYCMFDRSLKSENIKSEKLLVIIWVIFDLSAILYPGKSFGHYFIQLMLPVSMFAANFLDPQRKMSVFPGRLLRRPVGTVIVIILVSVIIYTQKKDYIDKPDYPKQISKYLAARMDKNDNIYTGNYHHVIYFLLGKGSPAKYVHRTLILDPNHIKALDIDIDAEIERIIDAEPSYIIYKGTVCFRELHDFIDHNYELVKTYDTDIYIYKKTDG